MSREIYVDLDKTLLDSEDWKGIANFGQPYPGAQDFVRELREHGKVILFTSRVNAGVNGSMKMEELLGPLMTFLQENGFEFDGIWIKGVKPYGSKDLVIDDRAVCCAPGRNVSFSSALARVEEMLS